MNLDKRGPWKELRGGSNRSDVTEVLMYEALTFFKKEA